MRTNYFLFVSLNLISDTSFHVLAIISCAWHASHIPARILLMWQSLFRFVPLLDNWVHSQVLVITNILNSLAINILMQVLPLPFPSSLLVLSYGVAATRLSQLQITPNPVIFSWNTTLICSSAHSRFRNSLLPLQPWVGFLDLPACFNFLATASLRIVWPLSKWN